MESKRTQKHRGSEYRAVDLNAVKGDDAVNTHFTLFPLRRLLPVRQQTVQRKEKQKQKQKT